MSLKSHFSSLPQTNWKQNAVDCSYISALNEVLVNRTRSNVLEPSYLDTVKKIHKTLADKTPLHQRRNQCETALKKVKKLFQPVSTTRRG